MLPAILITILPTLLFYILLPKIGITIKSQYLKIGFSWFAGIYCFSFITFFIALLFSNTVSPLLRFASFATLFLTIIALCFLMHDLKHLFRQIRKKKTFFKLYDTFLLLFCLLFSVVLFAPHLITTGGTIFTSTVYWDFHWHAAVIQNFVHGDNFPPENETLAGIPMTYHFFGYLVFAIYSAVGLSLVGSINVVSIVFFFMLLITMIGICKEFFHSKLAGFFAVLLMITSSSLHFLYYFLQRKEQPFTDTFFGIFTNKSEPWTASFIPGNPYDYAGILFNLFYLIEERHMIIGLVFLLISFWIIVKRHMMGNKTLIVLGMLMGMYFLWHLYIALMILCALSCLLIFDKERKQTVLLLIGFLLTFGAQYLLIKYQISQFAEFATQTTSYPQLSFAFPNPVKELTPINFLIERGQYYLFAYGFKLFLLPLALIVLWWKDKKIALTLAAILIPTFILIHTVQLVPGVIGENHKWLRPMNLFVDLAVAYVLYDFFFKRKASSRIFLGIICLVLLTFSGIIELMPFLHTKPDKPYAMYPSPMIEAIWKHSSPNASFIGKYTDEIHLAGRKLFTGGMSIGAERAFNKTQRNELTNTIYLTTDITKFCNITQAHHIDFVGEHETIAPLILSTNADIPSFKTVDDDNKPTLFIDTKKLCKK